MRGASTPRKGQSPRTRSSARCIRSPDRGRFVLACQPPPPRLSALGRKGVEPLGQRRKGGDRLLSLRLFGLELGGVPGVARGEVGDQLLGLRSLGGQIAG